jgi:6-pyruvoyltetrahydropterin/6-carboxytetrahydropterin synthase
MYELSVQREFCAAHAIVIGGRREPIHGHNWRVTIAVAGEILDEDGLLCDFHVVERQLDRVVAALHNRDLNTTPPFDKLNPTAEHVARHIAQVVSPSLPPNVRLVRASVTEAPGCEATYRPG